MESQNRFVLTFARPDQTKNDQIMKTRWNGVDGRHRFNINRQLSNPVGEVRSKGEYNFYQNKGKSTAQFDTSITSSITPCYSIPPLPIYRSQENIFMSSPGQKVLNQNDLSRESKRKMSVSAIIPFTRTDSAQNINSAHGSHYGQANSRWKECPGNLNPSGHRRRASIVTIHMITPQNKVENNFHAGNASNYHSSFPSRNNLCDQLPTSDVTQNKIHHPAHHSYRIHTRALDNDDVDKQSDKRPLKFRSSTDLTVPPQGNNHRKSEIGETHRSFRRVQSLQQKQKIDRSSEFTPPSSQDRNIFKIYIIKIKSIASPSDDDYLKISPSESEEGGSKKGTSTASTTLVYKDFDDMIAKMLEAKDMSRDGESGLSDAQLYFTRQLKTKLDFPSDGLEKPHSDESRKRACDHLTRIILKHRIDNFNSKYPSYDLHMIHDSDIFGGSIQVVMNLMRPVKMETSNFKELVHPSRDTVKVLRITSDTPTREVIRKFLKEFNINENPRKFSLYHELKDDIKVRLRRLDPDDRPLRMYLAWAEKERDWNLKHSFLLQENDTGEVEWELFSLPELKSFLRMLSKEERKLLHEIKLIYRTLQRTMKKRIKELENDDDDDDDDSDGGGDGDDDDDDG